METLHSFIKIKDVNFDIAKCTTNSFVLPSNVYDALRKEYTNETDFSNACKFTIYITSRTTLNEKFTAGYDYIKIKKFLIDSNLIKMTRKHANYIGFHLISLHEFTNIESSIILDFKKTKSTLDGTYYNNIKENHKYVLENSLVDINKLYSYCTDNELDITETCSLINSSLAFNADRRYAKHGIKVERIYSSLTSLSEIIRQFVYIEIDEVKYFFSSYDLKTAQAKILALHMNTQGISIDDNYIKDVFHSDFYMTLNRKLIEHGYTSFIPNVPIQLKNGKYLYKINLALFGDDYRDIIKQAIIGEIFYGNRTCNVDANNGCRFVISTVFKMEYPKVYEYIAAYRRICLIETVRKCKQDSEFQKYKNTKNKKKLNKRYKELSETMASDFQSHESRILLSGAPDTYMFSVHDCLYATIHHERTNLKYLQTIVDKFKVLDSTIKDTEIFVIKKHPILFEDVTSKDFKDMNAGSFYTEEKKRKCKVDEDILIELINKGKTNSEITKELNISSRQLLRYKQKLKN